MNHSIRVFGLNGSGKSTVGAALAERLGYKHMDIEDYAFAPSDVTYANPRSHEEYVRLMLEDAEKYPQFVLSAVDEDFGEEITSRFALAVWLDAPHDVRMERVRRRSYTKFGNRILEGGDLYEQEQKFFNFVASRSLSGVEQFANTLACPVIKVDGTKSVSEIVDEIMMHQRRELRSQRYSDSRQLARELFVNGEGFLALS
jgi:adenylate kinase family enzyme